MHSFEEFFPQLFEHKLIKNLLCFKAIEYFEKLLHDLDAICSLSLDPVLDVVLQSVVQFQKSKPDLVARAYLQVCLECFIASPFDLSWL